MDGRGSGVSGLSHQQTRFYPVLTRCLAAVALFSLYGGASALILGASSHAALARGGFHGGGFHHRGFGWGFGPYPYYGYGGYWPYDGDAGVCYAVRQRVKTRWGWGVRRVSICE